MPTRRLFFALWPDVKVRCEIVSAFTKLPQFACAGKPTVPENLHLTLHFIGNVDAQMVDCLHRAAQTLRAAHFSLQLDTTGYFKQPQIFWMGCTQIPVALQQLHQQLAQALLPCGYQAESRPFTPHVTLMRKVREPGDSATFQPIIWPVKSFSLIESTSSAEGVSYVPLENYLLQ